MFSLEYLTLELTSYTESVKKKKKILVTTKFYLQKFKKKKTKKKLFCHTVNPATKQNKPTEQTQ